MLIPLLILATIAFVVLFVGLAWHLNERYNKETGKDILAIEKTKMLAEKPMKINVRY